MLKKFSWPILIFLLAIFTGALTWFNTGEAIRPPLLFLFMLICPGMAFIHLARLEDPLAELVLAIALSIVIDTCLAEFMVLTRLWYPGAGLAVLIGISIFGATLQIIDLNRHSPLLEDKS